MAFNLADLFEHIADAVPGREALYAEGRTLTYRELDRRANRLAHHFAAAGIGAGDHVGCHLMNGPEYLETMLALLKIRAVPINVNFRYVRDELRYLYDNADLVGLVYDTEFAGRVAAVLPDVPRLRHLLAVGPGGDLPAGSLRYEEALAVRPDDRAGFPARSADDLVIIYTGGTTGLPKGVVWRHEDLLFGGMSAGAEGLTAPEDAGPRAAAADPLVMFAAPPLMHGTSVLASFITFLGGGKVCLVRRYSGDAAVRVIREQGCQTMMIVGDAMAVPLLEALDALDADTRALPSLRIIASAGALLSPAVRARLGAHLPELYIVDSFGSTETGHSGAGMDGNRHFTVNDTTTVLDADLAPVTPAAAWWARWPAAATSPSATTGTRPRPPAPSSKPAASAGPCPATRPRWTPTAPSASSAAARSASTPAARRSTPKRSKPPSRPTRRSPTRSSRASPTPAGGSGSPRCSSCTPPRTA
ncbi:AMP-binding protein [Amycolatopsis sp. NPDC051128]|uniref:AMP-binding protein n=1 Tax=Amycolatopsis sp. NPDC051128 TaxID=3155412 RepID=UPI0034262FB1